MPLRLIEVVVSGGDPDRLEQELEDKPLLGSTRLNLEDGRTLFKLLVDARHSEEVLDLLEQNFGSGESFRAILLEVEATVPRLETKEDGEPAEEETGGGEEEGSEEAPTRVSREELHSRIAEGAGLTTVYLATVSLSTVVAAVGLWKDDVAVVIGAMVIAPLLGPNVALALATTLADTALIHRAVRTGLAGLLLSLAISVAIGAGFPPDPEIPAIASRTQVEVADVVLALAAGSAAVLAYTQGIAAALIGVMVAVALLPPLVAAGMLAGAARWNMAGGAGLLVVTNLICVNLAGVLTFLWQGVRPRTWWESDRADKATRRAVALWVLLLLILLAAITLAPRPET